MSRPKGSKDLKPRKQRPPHTPEAKAKISASLRDRIVSDETRAKISAASKGRQTMLGRKHSVETREKMRLAARARPKDPDASYVARHKRVYRLRGKAANWLCVDCGKKARDWSQRKESDPLDVLNYDPRCRSCHAIYDGKIPPIGNRLGTKNKAPLSDAARANIAAGHRGLKYRRRKDAGIPRKRA